MRLDEPLISPPRRRGRGRESFSALLSQPRKVWFTKIGASFHGICSPRRKVAHFAEVFIVPIDRQGDTSSITPTLMSTNGCLVILLFSERHMPAPPFSPQKRTNFKENRISRDSPSQDLSTFLFSSLVRKKKSVSLHYVVPHIARHVTR